MKKRLSTMTVWVLLSYQSILAVSVNDIQNTGKAVVPWFQIAAASFTIVKQGTGFFERKDKTDKTDNFDKN